MKEDVVLITLHRDLRLLRLAQRPIEIFAYDEGDGQFLSVATIQKPVIVCDACNAQVAVSEKDVEENGLPVGYAVIMTDGGSASFSEVVCGMCKEKYFYRLPSFNTLEDAGISPTFI